jgi:hypothetical protein
MDEKEIIVPLRHIVHHQPVLIAFSWKPLQFKAISCRYALLCLIEQVHLVFLLRVCYSITN